jgi:ankyrin repeat protein
MDNKLDDGFDEDEEEEGEIISEEECNNQLLEAARTNDAEQVELWLSKKANINFMKDGWNPILWAACNGNE